MEKLQKALQKAREQRHASPDAAAAFGQTSAALAADAPAAEAASDTQSLWDALERFEPSTKTLEKNRIVTASAGHLGASFDILRTKVLLAMRKNGWTRLAITSPTRSCGKTTTACNLAIGFARNPDQRTILIEFDLRRPSIAKTLDLPGSKDVTEMLLGEIPFEQQALRYRESVAIAAARKAMSDPTSVLTSKAVHDTLAEVEAAYAPDVMIFDLPPLLVGDDTRSVLKDVDCALLVVRAGVTTVSQIDTCEREIAEHTNVLGVVLNQCRDIEDDNGYYE